jgi:hypothetical protein
MNGSLITFNGTTDKLVVLGLTGANAVTSTGTAVLSSGTNQITATAGTAYDIEIDGELVFRVQDNFDAQRSTITSLEPELWADAIISTGALATMWTEIASAFPNAWSTDGVAFLDLSQDDLRARYDGYNGYDNLWVSYDELNNQFRSDQLPLWMEITATQQGALEKYYGGVGAALRDGGGSLLVDGEGFLIYPSP